MRTLILDTAHYASQSFSDVEEFHILEKSWMFVGLIDEVSEAGCYKLVKLWGRSYILYNNNGEFRFYKNVCPHRGSEIITCSGRGNLKCPYHGWVFNSGGKAFVAGKSFFSEIDSDISLEQLRCEVVGQFIFVTRNSSLSLGVFLGKYKEYLLFVSSMMQLRIDKNSMEISANWKVVVENTLESYHVNEVHPGSLAPHFVGKSKSEFDIFSSSVVEDFSTNFSSSLKMVKKVFFAQSEFNNYKHVFIFPNLTIASSGYTNFFIQEFCPRDVNSSYFVSHGFLPEFKKGVSEVASKDYIAASVDFNRRVFSEDKGVCEGVQRGFHNSSEAKRRVIISEKEDRFEHFVLKYQSLVRN